MEQKINIAEKLKNCPRGTMLWSSMYGIVELEGVTGTTVFSINVFANDRYEHTFDAYGHLYVGGFLSEECLLFPSKDCRTWEDFKAPKEHKHFEPFQKVLVKANEYDTENDRARLVWEPDLYSYYDEAATDKKGHHQCMRITINLKDDDIIPYEGNEDMAGKEVEE